MCSPLPTWTAPSSASYGVACIIWQEKPHHTRCIHAWWLTSKNNLCSHRPYQDSWSRRRQQSPQTGWATSTEMQPWFFHSRLYASFSTPISIPWRPMTWGGEASSVCNGRHRHQRVGLWHGMEGLMQFFFFFKGPVRLPIGAWAFLRAWVVML